MAKLTTDDVAYVANLAKLKLTKGETKKFQKQLSSVIAYIKELNEVDVSNVDPTSQVTGLENITRKDEIKIDGLDSDLALSGTEKVHNGYFVVPRIIEENSDY